MLKKKGVCLISLGMWSSRVSEQDIHFSGLCRNAILFIFVFSWHAMSIPICVSYMPREITHIKMCNHKMIFIRMPCLIRIIDLKWKIKAAKANMMLNFVFSLKHFDRFSFCLNTSNKGEINTSSPGHCFYCQIAQIFSHCGQFVFL